MQNNRDKYLKVFETHTRFLKKSFPSKNLPKADGPTIRRRSHSAFGLLSGIQRAEGVRRIRKIKKRDDLSLLYKINNIITERNLVQPDQRILLAISGGQDSILLLKILFHLKKKWNWKLGIIHCDHQWNRSSKFQAEHVASLAVNLQINYHEGIAIESVQKEGSARIWRYNLIQTIAISNKYTAIITGHNASDRIETLIYNLTRGSGLHGLQSIKWKRYLCFSHVTQSVLCRSGASSFLFQKLKYRRTFDWFSSFLPSAVRLRCAAQKLYLIRPLLESTRTEIRTVLNIWNFPSWPDGSNKELKIKRNRIRHRLIPYIRLHYNPNIDQILVRWAEIVQTETFYLEQVTNYILSKIEMKKRISYAASHTGFRGRLSSETQRDLSASIGTISLKEFRSQKKSLIKNLDYYQSAIPIDLLRSLPLTIQRRLLKQYIYINTNRILGFQYIEQIRLSCLVHTYLSNNNSIQSRNSSQRDHRHFSGIYDNWKDKKNKKSKFVTPWIIFPGAQLKLLIRKNYIFLFSPLRS